MATLLAADIGGTNSRFAVFSSDGKQLNMKASIWIETVEASSFQSLLDAVWQSDLPVSPGSYDFAVIGVPGRVLKAGRCPEMPNIPWSIDLGEVTSFEKATLINDFEAQAYACQTSVFENGTILQEGVSDPGGTIAVIGAGTGLGASILSLNPTGWQAHPSEFGHSMYPFTGSKEGEFERFLATRMGEPWVSNDAVVSGRGLSSLHAFLSGNELRPDEITRGVEQDDETLVWFSRLYARACRNWALSTVSSGGLVVCGGLAVKAPQLVQSPVFLNEFHKTHVYADFLSSIPITMNNNEESGLYGAAYCGMQILNQRGI